MYPIADPERVPIFMAMVYSCFCPIIIIAVYTLLLDGMFSNSKKGVARSSRYTWADRLWELNCGVLGLFLAQGTAFVITGSLKNLIGKPRPDLLQRCIVNTTIIQQTLNETLNRSGDPGPTSAGGFGLYSREQLCTTTNQYLLQDGKAFV